MTASACCICGAPILDVDEMVCPAAEPWRLDSFTLLSIAHVYCADSLLAEALAREASDEADWQDAIGEADNGE